MTEAAPEPTDPAGYRHWVDDVIRFCDQDSGGHVNNVAFAAYIEHGRVSTMRAAALENASGVRLVLARLEIDFLAEAHFPGRLRIGTVVERVGNSSIGFRGAVFQDGRCLAVGRSVIVHVAGDRAAPLPDPVRAKLQALSQQ